MQTLQEITGATTLNGTAGYAEETVGQIAARDFRKAKVFKQYGLDICCGGKKTVAQACTEKGLNIAEVESALVEIERIPAKSPIPYDEWSADFLCDYIVNTHHSYVRKNLPDISAYVQKVARVHGKEHSELLFVQQLVSEVHEELMAHTVKEERVLFPYIKQLVMAENGSCSLPEPHFGSVQNPVNMMEMEHELVGDHFKEIRRITDNYTPPEGACGSYIFLYRLLEEFEEDLHLHIHLENNILFPKALKIEKQLIHP